VTSDWTPAARRLGIASAWGVVALSVAYVATGVMWLVAGDHPHGVAGLDPGEPYLSVLEWLLVITAPLMVLVMVAVVAYAAREGKAHALAALSFMLVASLMTCGIHFARLTVVRRLPPADAAAFASLVSFRWPAVAVTLDLLAWDLFLGLALLFAAPVFRAGRERGVRGALNLAGGLCVAGLGGPASGNLRVQLLAIAGYAFVFPITCVLLARHFARRAPDQA